MRKICFFAILLMLFLLPPGAAPAREIARDGRFVAYDDGTILDTRTNLMWAARDNGKDINWSQALSYVNNFRGGGYRNWRLPTVEELAGLYDKSKVKKVPCHYEIQVPVMIGLTCAWAWAADTRETNAAIFNYINGTPQWVRMFFHCPYTRVLPVRNTR